MDIKGKISEIVEKIKNDPNLMQKFKTNPIEAIEGLIGVDIPDEMVAKVVDGVKAKLASDKLSGAVGTIKNLF